MTAVKNKILYIFLDEGGNLDFSARGTKYFTLTSISKFRPFEAYKRLNDLKYDIIEKDGDFEYFHASEDRQIDRLVYELKGLTEEKIKIIEGD